MMTSFRQTYIDALKYYYYVGGTPEAVLSFSEEMDFNEVRSIQKRILAAYEQDFRIMRLWSSFRRSACSGTVSRRNLQRKIKNSFMKFCGRVHEPRSMKQPLCGSPTEV